MKEDGINWFGVLIASKDVILGALGGVVAYLFDYSKASRCNTPFKFLLSSMIINMMLGAFVAYLTGSLFDSDFKYRDAMVGLSGVTAYNILLLAESKFAEALINRFMKGGK